MAIHVALHHRTHYRYDRWVNLGAQVIRLRPAPHCRTPIESYSLRLEPAQHFLNWQQDPQSNYLARVVFPEKTREFIVEVDLVATMAVLNPFDFFLEPEAEQFPFAYDRVLDHELAPFRLLLPVSPKFGEYLEMVRREIMGGARTGSSPPGGLGRDLLPSGRSGLKTVDLLVAVNRQVQQDIKYLIRLEPGVQAPEETLQAGSGSCRDSAWLLCQLLRHLGLASRFVSGYLIQLTADVKSLDGPTGTDQDFTDLHAWCEVYLPGAGWIGLDPTSGLLAGEGHLPLAAAPDPISAAPITGLIDECESDFAVEMAVTRIAESPRVTKPYTPEQWVQIEAAGHLVDAELQGHDCRLTMGGEPTFVSVDDMDGPEWNTVALGPTKRRLGDRLVKRLKSRFAAGGLLHYGQGKWYPGESLPRWAFACYWRKDGEPIWTQDALFADETKNYGYNAKRAEEFIYALAERLGCGGKWVLPAFEDVWYYLWKERRLPTNVDPFQSRLRSEEDRARIARVFERGLDDVIGYTLPLRPDSQGEQIAWQSGPWFLRPERCYLIPGDSAMGFRLPLDSLPWVRESDYPYVHPPDPFDARVALPPRQAFLSVARRPLPLVHVTEALEEALRHSGGTLPPADAERVPGQGESAPWLIRTALCVEPRHGRLHIFMPPARTMEEYLSCVTAVEDVAQKLDTPVIVEGYTPPFDPRLNVLKVTPDPGVIEVNVQPVASWDELVRQTEGLYEDAHYARLGTEKFMLDGRHTGTGGGNHIVLGGTTPADSPLLRRPDLLRSLITYWQNHPSLSFLFSGLFIGPTSQSPRVDEARNDSLYELDLALKQVPHGDAVPPWLVDRLFRNLLIDASGNTHRAEFCMDKLYSPESASGRLGLLEMRAFEMPPHPRMSLAQQLLLRTLVARFWKEPYQQKLVRWGTEIHDRWMLPHFVWADFSEVMREVQAAGFPMRAEWFAPHFEFRFPAYGQIAVNNLTLELRQALEPWHVLGEEPGAGGTVRYVDSSLERVQVLVRGMVGERHRVGVNGVAMPLHPTGTHGEFVAGVRYRAWQPASCLHPNIPVHAPLVFDLFDGWNGRSVGGCTYHVAHPGGRNYSTFPVNAYEAESRRLARFTPFGHTPGAMALHVPPTAGEFPFTLDLRSV
ncbi:MAG: transglutaminase family protein [Verrucomicrobiota bacterium]